LSCCIFKIKILLAINAPRIWHSGERTKFLPTKQPGTAARYRREFDKNILPEARHVADGIYHALETFEPRPFFGGVRHDTGYFA
jgi:hypothetical protein